MDWYPKAPLTAFQACHGCLFSSKQYATKNVLSIFVNIQSFYLFDQTMSIYLFDQTMSIFQPIYYFCYSVEDFPINSSHLEVIFHGPGTVPGTAAPWAGPGTGPMGSMGRAWHGPGPC